MRHIVIMLLMLLVACTAFARDLPRLTSDSPEPAAVRYDGDCVVGNPNIDGYIGHYTDWWMGPEKYAIPFNPSDEGCSCSEGITVRAVHMYLALDELTHISVAGVLFEAYDDGSGCLVPGAERYVSDPVIVAGLPEEGLYDVEIPMDAPCVDVNRTFFVAVHFRDDNGGNIVGIPIDDASQDCYDYNIWALDWEDVVADYGFVGDVILWADIDCCEDVANEASSWGSVKGIYRH